MIASRQPKISPEDYLAGELQSPIKHEYRDGQIYAMAGASDRHNAIVFMLPQLIGPHLRKMGCRGYASDMKVKLESTNDFYYPDLLVSCDPRDQSDQYFKRFPKLIIEVLSNKMERFDRGEKFEDYQEIETLEEYVLISQKKIHVDLFRRNPADRWELYVFKVGSIVELASIGFSCPIEAIYEDVNFELNEPE